jgi:SnoaL-like domain
MDRKLIGRAFATTLLALLTPGTAMALESPMIVAGGQLDPAFPDADVYIGIPAAPTIPPGRACALAARYVELVNAGKYLEVAALFADDATFLEPMRPNLHGRQQIDEFYTKRIGGMAPQVMGVSYFGNDSECMVELALHTEIAGQKRWVLVSIDHFILGADGKVKTMAAFARPVRG